MKTGGKSRYLGVSRMKARSTSRDPSLEIDWCAMFFSLLSWFQLNQSYCPDPVNVLSILPLADSSHF